jgi:hypothetical protein
LRPLWAALPHLKHLHLRAEVLDEQAVLGEAPAVALAPLQASTSLTSLVLHLPWCCETILDDPGVGYTHAAHVELLGQLPSSLRSLSLEPAQVMNCRDLLVDYQLAFAQLTALTHLRLGDGRGGFSHIPEHLSADLEQLQKLELVNVTASNELLVAQQERLVALAPGWQSPEAAEVLDQLTHLVSLDLRQFVCDEPDEVLPLLHQAPPLQHLCVPLCVDRPPALGQDTWWDGDLAMWRTSYMLQQYQHLSGVQRPGFVMYTPQAVPHELGALTQLKQLMVDVRGWGGMKPPYAASWAQALAGLVNLEVLRVPAGLTECQPPWLTGLTRLVVLEVCYGVADPKQQLNPALVAYHISPLLAAPDAGSSSSSSKPGRQCQGGVFVWCASMGSSPTRQWSCSRRWRLLCRCCPLASTCSWAAGSSCRSVGWSCGQRLWQHACSSCWRNEGSTPVCGWPSPGGSRRAAGGTGWQVREHSSIVPS